MDEKHEQVKLDISKYGDLEQPVVFEMLRLFRGDNRRVMRQKASGQYGVLHWGSLSPSDLKRHLRGQDSISIYLLDESCNCCTLCFDIDIPKIEVPESPVERTKKKATEFLPIAIDLIRHIQSSYGASEESFLLEDTGGRGYHVWLFFEKPQPADRVVTLAREVKRSVGKESIETFPSRPEHGPSGFSKSNVRLPLGTHRKYKSTSSVLLHPVTGQNIPTGDLLAHLRKVRLLSPEILDMAQQRTEKQTKEVLARPWKRHIKSGEQVAGRRHLASVGKMLSLCPALSALVAEATRNGHLGHHKRLALALTLIHCTDGEARLRQIMSYCSDYSADETQKHIDSLRGYYPVSCRSLQGPRYSVCPGWCCPQLEKAMADGHAPTPLWFSRLSQPKEGIKTDGSERSLIDRVASIENLHHAWIQARVQARERDIFEDILAYEAFEQHLWANLHVLRAELLSGTWQHQAFRVAHVPKKKNDPDSVRPMCWATPWDAIVALAVLSIIGPHVDSLFHERSLGYRLARGPKADGQVFEDWRRQNLYREIRREGFSEYPDEYHYVLTDITRFFEFVRHDRLMVLLRKHIDDQQVLDVIQRFLGAEWLFDNSTIPRVPDGGSLLGLPQGPALSAFLANLYLDELDHWLERRCVDFVRYVDDLALLFQSRRDAENALKHLRKFLSEEFFLEISGDPEKTRGPFSAGETTHLTDWIREMRYELIKYSRLGRRLTATEKNEMRTALALVSGASLAQGGDIERLTKYLGFYVASTERLEQNEEQRAVLVLALYILGEERPKHNATCIALRALVRACSEFGAPAWKALTELLLARDDEYLRVILAQETRRLLEEDDFVLDIYPDLMNALEEQSISSSAVAAAAAITCLGSIREATSTVVDRLQEILKGDSSYLRPKAALALARLGQADQTALARVVPESGDECALLLVSIQSAPSKPVVDSLGETIRNAKVPDHAVPALLFSSLIVGSRKGLSACSRTKCLEVAYEKHHILYYVSAQFVETVVAGQNSTDNLVGGIRTCVATGLPTLAEQVYTLGRYSRVISEMPDIDEILTDLRKQLGLGLKVPTLPAMEDVTLGDLLMSVSPGVWLHEGTRTDGAPLYHELMTESDLQPIGQCVEGLATVLETLRRGNLLLADKIDVKREYGTKYLMATCARDGDWRTLAEWVAGDETHSVKERALVVRKSVELLHRMQALLYEQNHPSRSDARPHLPYIGSQSQRRNAFSECHNHHSQR